MHAHKRTAHLYLSRERFLWVRNLSCDGRTPTLNFLWLSRVSQIFFYFLESAGFSQMACIASQQHSGTKKIYIFFSIFHRPLCMLCVFLSAVAATQSRMFARYMYVHPELYVEMSIIKSILLSVYLFWH